LHPPGEQDSPASFRRARWAADNAAGLKDARPARPPGFSNWLAVNWRLLLAIANIAVRIDYVEPGATMKQREPNLVRSDLSGPVKKDGVTVEVSIVRLEDELQWSLEVVNSSGTSIVWHDLFLSDESAYAEFQRTVAEEGIQTFLDIGNVIPFRPR
jgi:hypothetical protein